MVRLQARPESPQRIPTPDGELDYLVPPAAIVSGYISNTQDQHPRNATETPSQSPTRDLSRTLAQTMRTHERSSESNSASREHADLPSFRSEGGEFSYGLMSALSSGAPELQGPSFQIPLRNLLRETGGHRLASTHSTRLSSYKSFTDQELALRDRRLRADRYRRTALLKRRDLRERMKTVSQTLQANIGAAASDGESTSVIPIEPIVRHFNGLHDLLQELEGIEEELDLHEVEIVQAEWRLSQAIPRLFGSGADKTFEILVQNDAHFPAEDYEVSASIADESLQFEGGSEPNDIVSNLETVNDLERRMLALNDQSLNWPLIYEDFEPASIPLPPEKAAELQQLRDTWKKVTLDLEESRDTLDVTSNDVVLVQQVLGAPHLPRQQLQFQIAYLQDTKSTKWDAQIGDTYLSSHTGDLGLGN